MAEASWKNKMTERWKPRYLQTLKEDLTLERLVIQRPITEVMKEDIYYPINIEADAPLPNQSSEEKKCQNSKLKYLNNDLFAIFYDDYIDLNTYITDILKNNFKPPHNLFTEKAEELQQKENDDNTIHEINDQMHKLSSEKDSLKQDYKTFLKMIELMQRGTDKEELSVQSKIKKSFENKKQFKNPPS